VTVQIQALGHPKTPHVALKRLHLAFRAR
jgi:hypothetical protein